MSSTPPAGRRIDPAVVRRTLREAGLRPRHSLSQNFLADPEVLEVIVDEADPSPGERILEIGPGLGILTTALLEAGAAVTAVEVDRGLVRRLRAEHERALVTASQDATAAGALTLIQADALDLDLTTLVPSPYAVVANLPYHITSPVLHRLLGAEPRATRLVLMVQREVAERIAAAPGHTSYLSVFCQYQARVRIAALVPASAFEPAPAVESAVLVLEPWTVGDEGAPGRLGPEAEDGLWRVVQAAFRERRKMLRNVLARQLPVSQVAVDAALEAAGIVGSRRPQTLGVEEWLRLVAALGPVGPDERGRRAERPDSRRQPADEEGVTGDPAAALGADLPGRDR